MFEALARAFAFLMERLDVGRCETLLPEQFPDIGLTLSKEIASFPLPQFPLPKTELDQSRRQEPFRQTDRAETLNVP